MASEAATAAAAGAASVLIASLERAWEAIVARHPEVPPAVLVVAPGQGRARDGLKLGHFAAGRWDVAGSERAEVLVGGEGLRLGPEELLGTLLHEAAHGLGHARSVSSTSRGGRYHNAQYRQLAEELGLKVAQVGSIGWSDTSVPEELAELYRPVLEDLGHALVLWRRADGAGAGASGGASRNLLACRCRCQPPRAIRVAEGTLRLGPITCGMCDEEFEAVDA